MTSLDRLTARHYERMTRQDHPESARMAAGPAVTAAGTAMMATEARSAAVGEVMAAYRPGETWEQTASRLMGEGVS